MTGAVMSLRAQIERSSDGGATWVAIPECQGIALPEPNPDFADVTGFGGPGAARRFVKGYCDHGTIVLPLNYTRAGVAQQLADEASHIQIDYRVTLENGDRVQFSGFPTVRFGAARVGQMVPVSVSVRLSGAYQYLANAVSSIGGAAVSDPDVIGGGAVSGAGVIQGGAVNDPDVIGGGSLGQQIGGGVVADPDVIGGGQVSGVTGPTATNVSVGAQDANGNVPITVTGLSADSPNSKWVLTTAQQVSLTAAQVVAGTDENGAAAADAGSVNITTASPSFDATLKTGLDATFYLYIVFGDISGNYSATPYEVGPIAIDTTNPIFSAVTGVQTGQTTANWGATSNEAGGTIYAAVRLASDPVLPKADILAGTGNAVATSTDATPTADGNNGGSFTGLVASTAYQVDAYHDDGTGNTSSVASSSSFTTAASASNVVQVQAVEVINSTTVTNTFTGSSITIGAGANRALVLEVMGYNDLGSGAKGAASVSHNGQSATLFKSGNNGAKNWAEHWIILNPTTGAGTTTVVTNANQEGIGVVARELNNVDQATPTPGTGNGGNGTGVSAPVTLTTLYANSLIIGSLSIEGGNAGTVTGTNGATSLLQNASGTQGFADITFGSAIESVAAASADGFDLGWPTSKKFQWIASEIKAA